MSLLTSAPAASWDGLASPEKHMPAATGADDRVVTTVTTEIGWLFQIVVEEYASHATTSSTYPDPSPLIKLHQVHAHMCYLPHSITAAAG